MLIDDFSSYKFIQLPLRKFWSLFLSCQWLSKAGVVEAIVEVAVCSIISRMFIIWSIKLKFQA